MTFLKKPNQTKAIEMREGLLPRGKALGSISLLRKPIISLFFNISLQSNKLQQKTFIILCKLQHTIFILHLFSILNHFVFSVCSHSLPSPPFPVCSMAHLSGSHFLYIIPPSDFLITRITLLSPFSTLINLSVIFFMTPFLG